LGILTTTSNRRALLKEKDLTHLQALINAIREIDGVMSVERVFGRGLR